MTNQDDLMIRMVAMPAVTKVSQSSSDDGLVSDHRRGDRIDHPAIDRSVFLTSVHHL